MKNLVVNDKNIQQYLTNSINARPPEFLILDLYDGCIKFLNIAKEMYEKNSINEFEYNLNRSDEIIKELIRSLDFNKGGEIAKNLNELYIFIRKSILDAKKYKNIIHLNDALKIVTMMRNNWNEGIIKTKNNNS